MVSRQLARREHLRTRTRPKKTASCCRDRDCSARILAAWATRLRLFFEPSSALVATVAWDVGDGIITGVNVWDNRSAVGDFFVERVQPVIEAEGHSDDKPVRHGNAVVAYFRA